MSSNGASFTDNSANSDSDIKCGTEIPGTYCAISGGEYFST